MSADTLPTGTVTFLFTDIEGSTQLLKRLGARYGDVLADHRNILRTAAHHHGGREVDTQGDSFLFAFPRADEAARAATAGQRALAGHEWPAGTALRVRMGIHTAEPSASADGYWGLGVHRAARIMAAAHGGQVLVSLASTSVLEDAVLDGAELRDLGEYWLKDLDRPERIYQLDVAGLQSIFPPPGKERPRSVAEPDAERDGEGLLERADAISTLEDSLDEVVRTGRGQLVLVSGEAGVGKTALLQVFCGDRPASVRTLWGACDPLFAPRALGPLVDVGEATAGELRATIEEGGKPQAVAAALTRELGSREATMLVLEDLHWADEATLDVVALLGRRIDTVPALTILTYRDDELDRRHPLRLLLGALATARAVRRLELAPLSRTAVGELAEPHGIDADELFRRTAGNPFFAREAVAAAQAEVPLTVRDAVLARTAALTAPAEVLLGAVAVAPPHVPLWLLETLAEDELDRLEECLASGMLTHSTSGVAFRHELARLAVEESLPPHRSLDLHRRALAALANPPTGEPDLERLAHHAGGAGDGEAVLRYAPAAAERAAALGAHREAATQYGRALEFADRLPPRERAELLKRSSHEYYLTDQVDEAVDALERAVASFQELGDARGEGDSLRKLGSILWCPGRTAEAAATARKAITVLEQLPPSPELAMAYGTMATLCKNRSDADEALSWATNARQLAERLDEVGPLAHALNTLGTTELLAGKPDGLDELERSLALSEQSNLPDDVGRAMVHLLQVSARLRRYDLADRYLARGFAYVGERGLDLWRTYLNAFGAKIALDRGRWAEADELSALVFQKRVISTLPRILASVVIGLLRARRGQPDAASPLDDALALAEPTGELIRIAPVAAARAELAWLAGDREGIADATEAAFELALGHPDPWTLGELSSWRRRAGLEGAGVDGLAAPYAAETAGEWARAAELWTGLGCPYDAALALATLDDEQALRRALAGFERLGATRPAAVVAARLA